jgi:hypothetical protein
MRLREEGREEGRAQKGIEDVLRILDRRGIEVPDLVRDRVAACTDLAGLEVRFDRALVVDTAEALFVE